MNTVRPYTAYYCVTNILYRKCESRNLFLNKVNIYLNFIGRSIFRFHCCSFSVVFLFFRFCVRRFRRFVCFFPSSLFFSFGSKSQCLHQLTSSVNCESRLDICVCIVNFHNFTRFSASLTHKKLIECMFATAARQYDDGKWLQLLFVFFVALQVGEDECRK